MEIRVVKAAALLAALVASAAVASAAVGVTMKSSKSAELGATIVVSATGRTLYHTNVERNDAVKCTGACATTWPPLLIKAGRKPVPGAGVVASKLGTVVRPDGKTQVTYAGYPLYRYIGDTKAGEVNGQGTAGLWHAVAPSGKIVTKAPSTAMGSTGAPAGGTTTTTPSTAGGGDYGYGY